MTDQSKKYINYFDEEEKDNSEIKSTNTQNNTSNPAYNKKSNEKPKDQIKINNAYVFLDKTENTEETNSPIRKQSNNEPIQRGSSDSFSKNSEYKMPFPKNKTKKDNGNNNNNNPKASDNKMKISNNDNEKDLGDKVEYYESLGDLINENNDENMEYDLIGLDELQEYLAGGVEGFDLDFKEKETEDPEKEIEKLEKNFNEDPLDYETLYKLIYLYRETKNVEKLKYFRNYTQMYFPISDDMWKEWIKDELIDINKNKPDNFELKIQLIDLFERALRDFYCKYIFS